MIIFNALHNNKPSGICYPSDKKQNKNIMTEEAMDELLESGRVPDADTNKLNLSLLSIQEQKTNEALFVDC